MITPEERAQIANIMGEDETEPLDAITRSNEQRERLALCTCNEPDRSGIGWTCALHHNKETRAASAEEALKPHCPDAQSAQMAKLIRKIEDMEFSMMRAVNYIEHGYRGEAKSELMKWIRGQG